MLRDAFSGRRRFEDFQRGLKVPRAVLAAMWRWRSDWPWDGKGDPVILVDHETGNEVRPLMVDENIEIRRLRVMARNA